jgi:hypothetical protein
MAFPEAVSDPSTLDSSNTNNLLQLARKLHDEHVREGMVKRDELIARVTQQLPDSFARQRLTKDPT